MNEDTIPVPESVEQTPPRKGEHLAPPVADLEPITAADIAAAAEAAKPGAHLAPPIEPGPQVSLYWFHVGLLPNVPRGQIDIAGVHFPKYQEDVRIDPENGKTIRTKKRGAVVPLSQHQLDELEKRLPKLFLRTFRSGVRIDGQNTGETSPRYGAKLMKEKSIEEHEREQASNREAGMIVNHVYRPIIFEKGDKRVAEVLYMRFLGGKHARMVDMDHPIPPPLIETGIPTIPDDATSADPLTPPPSDLTVPVSTDDWSIE